jgi:cell shape-determining protein MreD
MNWLNTVLILAAAVLAVFWEAAFQGVRSVLGAQIDLLPSIIVYSALCSNLMTVCLVASFGGLCFDSLSANPLGISVLPLFVVGFLIHVWRELILRDQPFAQVVLGMTAGLACPLFELLLLLTIGRQPQLGWRTLWQLIVMTLGSALVTPVFFLLFDWLHRTLVHAPVVETSFRPDREIRRGR